MSELQKRVYAAQGGFDRHGLLAQILVCSLLSAGIAGVLASFSGSVSVGIISIAEAVILSAVIAVIRRKPAMSGIAHAAAIIVFAGIVLLAFGAIQRAIVASVNNGIFKYNEAFKTDIMPYDAHPASEGGLIMLHCILTALAAMAVGLFVSKRRIIPLVITAMFFIAVTLFFKLPSQLVLIPLLFAGLVSCWGYCVTGGGTNLYIMCGAALLLSFAGSLILGLTGFGGLAAIDELHKNAGDNIYALRFGRDTLPKGDLSKARKMLTSDKDTLEVTFDGEPQTLYLKGFTGAELDGSKWKPTDRNAYLGDWKGVLGYFRKSDFRVQNMYSNYAKVNNREVERESITVENKGADRSYIYLPFTAEPVVGLGIEDDKDLSVVSGRLFGTNGYSFSNIKTNMKPELISPASWVTRKDRLSSGQKTYVENENVYRAFAKNTYLGIEPGTKKDIEELFYSGSDMKPEEMGVYAVTSRIRSVLSLATTYTAIPSEPRGDDFISWFLGAYKRGNSAYYATAAVMAYRAAGIPARYAEGYFVSEDDVATLKETGRNKIQLTAKNAHAWAEIYRDGIGWVSIEVTPGYYTPDTSMQEVIDLSKNLGGGIGAGENGSEHFTDSMSKYSPENVEKPEEMSAGVKFLLYLALLAIIALFGMYIRYIILAYKKNDMTYGQSRPDTASYMLGYICDALRADGIDANPDNPASFKEPMLGRYSDFTEPEFDRVISLMRRSSYGGARLREHELRTIRVFMEKLYRNVYKGKSPVKKFIMRYVKII